MTDAMFAAIWILSFFLYLGIYTWHIPLRTQKKIESWLVSEESDETLVLAMEPITAKIREQMLIDYEEFMLPQARESLKKFWAGAMGAAAKEIGSSEEGSQLSLVHSMTKELEDQPWYIQAAASKLLPAITKAAKEGGKSKSALKEINSFGFK
jgi:hypothetical protein